MSDDNNANKTPPPISDQKGPQTITEDQAQTLMNQKVKGNTAQTPDVKKPTGPPPPLPLANSQPVPPQSVPLAIPQQSPKNPQMSSSPQAFSPGSGSVINVHTEVEAIPIKLPSLGKLYANGIPDRIFLTEMRMREMMMLNTPALWQDNQIFQLIFQNCVHGLPDGFSVLDLFSLDKSAILVALRILSFGEQYEVKVTCPKRSCNHKYDHTINLESDLDVKYLESDKFQYPLSIDPSWLRCGRGVKLRLMTFRDELEIDRKADVALDKGSLVNTRLRDQMISCIDEVSDLQDAMILPWVEGLCGLDSSIIDQVMSKEYFGIDTEFTPKACPACGNKFTSTMPINENFFRSTLPKA